MDWKLLRSAAFDSFWNWLLGGVFTIISVITFFYPDLQPVINFPVLRQVLSPLGLLIIGIVIWLLGFAWNVRKQLKEKPSQNRHETYPANRNEVHGDGIAADIVRDSPVVKAGGSSVAVGRDLTFNQYVQHVQIDEKFDITPNVTRNEMWVSVDIPNPLNKPIECYCLLNSIKIDGNTRNDIKAYVTAHTSRVSWSGGDTKGKEDGVKLIDHSGTLNIATPTYAGLGFETAKGVVCQEVCKISGGLVSFAGTAIFLKLRERTTA